MDAKTIIQFAFATLLPVAACILLTLLRRHTSVAKMPNMGWQVLVGIIFGGIAIYGTEAGIPVDGAMMNVRDAAPLAAGLYFGGPAGIIAGIIGGVERWFSVMWGVGSFTQTACTLGTLFAGFYAALLRKYLFDDRMPTWPLAFASGVVAEVVHLLLVFVTNYDEVVRAFTVVQACSIPMITCVALSTALSALALALLNKQPLRVPRIDRGVAQIIQGRLLIAVVAAFFITTSFMAVLQTGLSRDDAISQLKQNIEDVRSDILDVERAYTSEEELAAAVEAAVKNRHVGLGGEFVALDNKANSAVSGSGWIPTDAARYLAADADAAEAGELFSTNFLGVEYYAIYQDVGDRRLIALMPVSEANFARDVSVLIISFMEVLIFATLFLVMYFVIKRVVVRSIWQVNGRLGEITNGDLDVVVDVRETSEFSSLSDDINKTVGVLKDSIATVQADLDMAADIQANSLPDITPAISRRDEFDLFATMEPAKEVGGDFYDFFFIDDDHLALVVADVSGKGVPAALFMMLSKTVIKMEALSGLNPDDVLYKANVDLSEKNDDDMFTTAWLGVLEISTGTLVYADAGHEKLAIYRNGTWELPKKPNAAVALATFAQADYDELPERFRFRTHTIVLQPGDAIFQYTDGVTEATDAEDELFGEERLVSALNDAPTADPTELLPFVRERIDAFVQDAPQFDDITMLGLRYR